MILIYRSTYEEMLSALLDLSPERGGILGAKQGRPISKFYFDKSGVSTPDSYTPDYNEINTVLEQWETKNIFMVGIAHSHNEDNILPSCGDLFYCERILLANPKLENLILPIVSWVKRDIKVFVCTLKEGRISVNQDDWQIVDDN